MFAACARFDLGERLAGVDLPVLAAHGDRDAFASREEVDWLVSALPRTRLSLYEGTGHAVHWEQPERLAAEIVEFARSVRGAAA